MRNSNGRRSLALALSVLSMTLAWAPAGLAGGGLFGIDEEWRYKAGIWKRNYQEFLEYGLIVGEVGGAVWEGGETRLGQTFWRSIDASSASGIVALGLKYAFSPVRPDVSNGDPNLWFKGHGNQSFPSGEVTEVRSIVAPFVPEYGHDYPYAYALELLPVYDGIARMKVQAHWASDAVAGFALGTGTAWLLQRNVHSPLILRVMLVRKETPRLCRGGSRSLTNPEVVHT